MKESTVKKEWKCEICNEKCWMWNEKKKKKVPIPGVEPGAQPWKGWMLPLHHIGLHYQSVLFSIILRTKFFYQNIRLAVFFCYYVFYLQQEMFVLITIWWYWIAILNSCKISKQNSQNLFTPFQAIAICICTLVSSLATVFSAFYLNLPKKK